MTVTEKEIMFESCIKGYSKNPELREGQILMIALKDVDPEAYKKISNSKADCFYDDSLIPEFCETLAFIWNS